MQNFNLTKRARSMFPAWANMESVPMGLRLLASYAAQNPGIEFANYGDMSAYRSDSARATRQLQAARHAISEAYAAGVTDKHLQDACRGDRLELIVGSTGAMCVDYCTGQYWPLEFRAAVARVVERATRIATMEK